MIRGLDAIIPPPGPVRTMCLSHFSKTAANGILMAISVLYFTRTVGIPAERVGVALSVGAAVGLLATIPAGRLADARGPRETTVVLLILLGLATCAYPFVGDFAGLLAVSAVVWSIEAATDGTTNTLIAGLLPPEERVRASSYLRVAANVSVIGGAAAGGIGLYVDTPGVYRGLLFGAGALFALSGLAYLSVPRVPRVVHESGAPIWPVLRDAPYATASLLNTILIMHSGILLVALPIWISEHTSAPAWLFPVVLIVNGVSVVLFQVRLSRGGEDVPGGARALRRSGYLLAVCCAVFALAAGLPVGLAAAVLLVGALVHVTGEMLHAVGSWSLGFGLAPEHAQGQYQGLFAMSSQLGQMITPALVAVLLTRLGATGWIVLAAIFLAAGVTAPAVARWAQRTRTSTGPTAVEAA